MADIAGSYPSLGAYRVILLGAEPWSTGALSLTSHIALSSLTGVAVGLPILPTHRRVDFKADLARTWTIKKKILFLVEIEHLHKSLENIQKNMFLRVL